MKRPGASCPPGTGRWPAGVNPGTRGHHLHRHRPGLLERHPDPARQGHQHPDPKRSRRDAAPAQEHRLLRWRGQRPINPNVAIAAKSDTYWQVAKDGMWRVISGHEGTGRRAFANTPTRRRASPAPPRWWASRRTRSTTRPPPRWSTATTPCSSPSPLRGTQGGGRPGAGERRGGSAMAAPVARHMLDAYLLPPEPQLPPAPEKPSQPSEVVSQ